MEEAIDDIYEELRERYFQLKIFGITEQELRPRLAIIDEAGEMVERLNAFHTSEAKYLALIEKAVAEGRNPDDVAKPKAPATRSWPSCGPCCGWDGRPRSSSSPPPNAPTSTSSPARPGATWSHGWPWANKTAPRWTWCSTPATSSSGSTKPSSTRTPAKSCSGGSAAAPPSTWDTALSPSRRSGHPTRRW